MIFRKIENHITIVAMACIGNFQHMYIIYIGLTMLAKLGVGNQKLYGTI